MPLFLSEEEFRLISNDASAMAERADVFICDLRKQVDVVRAEADAKSIAEEQNCAILEQKYAALYSEFSRLQYENAQLSASTEKCLSDLADVQAEKHQLHIKAIGKDGEIEKLYLEAAELRISKRQLLELVEQKDAEIRERISTIQSYVDKIVILQSEAIQELTNTSRELSLKQTENLRLREQLYAQWAENDLLKLSWETEKSKLEQMKSEAERNCSEMNEQNRILHYRLEALHVKLAEKEHNSIGLSSVNSQEDGDLQKVISYLRRSKEIAETEITLLKQEKMRLQSKSKNQSIVMEEELNSKYQQLSKEIEDQKIMYQAIIKGKDELNSRNQVLTKEKEDVSAKTQALAKEKEEFMSKIQALLKKKEELNSKNQAIQKQIEDLKSGRKPFGESEQAKKEQDTRLQKTGILASQLPSGSSLDEQTMTYFQSVSSFEAAKNSFLNDAEGPQFSPAGASTSDNSAAPTGQKIPTQQTRLPRPNSKFTEEREKASSVGRTVVETRKPGRRFVRPSLEKPEEPITDAEVSGMEISSTSEGKLNSSIENEALGDLYIVQPTMARKRLAPEPEILEGSVAQDEINTAAPPPHKRVKEPELSEISEASDIRQSSENPDTTPLQEIPKSEAPEMQISETKDELEHDKLPSVSNEGSLSTGKEAEDNIPVIDESEEQQKECLDFANPEKVQYDGDIIIEELSDRPSTPIKDAEIKEFLLSAAEGEGDKEEGELMPDDPEQQLDDPVSDERHHGLSIGGVGSGDEAEDAIEIASPNDEQGVHDSVEMSTLNDVEDVAEDSEKRDSSCFDQTTLGSDQNPEISTGVRDESPISLQQNLAAEQLTPNTPAETGDSQPASTTRTISISETARRNAQLRQARLQEQRQQQQQQKSSSRGRILPYRRGGSRGRGGRGL